MEGGLPLSSVRLVYPLTDRNTNETRDVVISAIRLGKRYTIKDDDEGRRVRYNRYIEGAKPPVLIEWPPKKKLDHPEYEDDTKRLLVEKVTFVPTLLKEPFPGAIIDELRHKYSKFRDRHDDDFIARKLALDEEEGKLEKQSRTLRGISVRETLQSSDARILRRARREAEGKIGAAKRIPGMKKPDAEMIAAFVGQHVLREKALAAQGLDRSPVGPSQSSLLNSEASLTTPSTETSAAIQQLSAASLSTPVPLASIF